MAITKHTEISKKKLSEALKGVPKSEETKAKISEGMNKMFKKRQKTVNAHYF